MAEPKFTREEGASPEEEYEILPHHEIQQLKEEIRKLKEFEITPSKKMHVTMIELNHKLDKLVTIFEDAMHEVRVEEGGLSFTDKMRPVMNKMNKILEQNSEIASGILAVADMVKDLKGKQALPPPPKELPRMPAKDQLPPLPGMQGAEPQQPSLPETGLPPMPEAAPKRTGAPMMSTPKGMPPPPPPPEKSPLPPPPRRRNYGL